MKSKKLLILSLAPLVATSLFIAGCNDQDAVSGGYPLTTCVVSGESLTSMGNPIVHDHKGTTVKFCCDDCINDFKKDPEKYLAKLNAAKL